MSLLKAALHPSGPALPPADPTDALAMDPGTLAALAARQQLDAALDAVGLLALGEVISVDRFAAVVQVGEPTRQGARVCMGGHPWALYRWGRSSGLPPLPTPHAPPCPTHTPPTRYYRFVPPTHQDVPYEGPLSSRSLQAAAPRIRRAAHWEQLAGAVRHPGLRAALGALGGAEGR